MAFVPSEVVALKVLVESGVLACDVVRIRDIKECRQHLAEGFEPGNVQWAPSIVNVDQSRSVQTLTLAGGALRSISTG